MSAPPRRAEALTVGTKWKHKAKALPNPRKAVETQGKGGVSPSRPRGTEEMINPV